MQSDADTAYLAYIAIAKFPFERFHVDDKAEKITEALLIPMEPEVSPWSQ